ncbi:hypothetical protein FZEAL_8274 [Fusarium zealandicum]|uniref:Negative regulator of differentiation 1 n=1 Tax=Fusarium zealandicum TaxID=1053134 RepID=A0A8H4UEX7_9HYPO|nr:hypothetical protein FZEAL_8274 [Fusarium zealandicum]
MERKECISLRWNTTASSESLANTRLIQGGVDDAAITLLSDPGKNPDTTSDPQDHLSKPVPRSLQFDPQTAPYQTRPSAVSKCASSGGGLHADTDPSTNLASLSVELPDKTPELSGQRRIERNAQRSIQLLDLVAGATYSDISAAVRGGQLLEIYLRPKEDAATISFVHEEDAAGFLDYSREHDLYIKNRKVQVRWNDQQFVVTGHVAFNISRGASRSFVIRKCDPNLTEKSIRIDLEHIHNLHVIKIHFVNNDCFISTSSVHTAMFARTCMMSRAEYKGSRIDWAPDECAQPLSSLPASAPAQRRPQARARSHKPKREPLSASSVSSVNHIVNRFQLLSSTDDDDDPDSSGA